MNKVVHRVKSYVLGCSTKCLRKPRKGPGVRMSCHVLLAVDALSTLTPN